MDMNEVSHRNICDDLTRLIETFTPQPSEEKSELLRAIDAYRENPALLHRLEQLENAISALVSTYLDEKVERRAN